MPLRAARLPPHLRRLGYERTLHSIYCLVLIILPTLLAFGKRRIGHPPPWQSRGGGLARSMAAAVALLLRATALRRTPHHALLRVTDAARSRPATPCRRKGGRAGAGDGASSSREPRPAHAPARVERRRVPSRSPHCTMRGAGARGARQRVGGVLSDAAQPSPRGLETHCRAVQGEERKALPSVALPVLWPLQENPAGARVG